MLGVHGSSTNNAIEEIRQKYFRQQNISRIYFELKGATILNPYCVSMDSSSNMIRCIYWRKKYFPAFVLKIEDTRINIAHNINLMMEMSNFPQIPYRLPEEIVQHIATFLGGSVPKSRYIPEDFSPRYQLAYKEPLPKFMSLEDIMRLNKLGYIEITTDMVSAQEKYFVMSEESYNSGLNPVLNRWYGNNIQRMLMARHHLIDDIFKNY